MPIVVVVPAAGVGRRMADELPKQYLQIAGRAVIEWSLAPFLARSDIERIVVALSPDDRRFAALPCAKDSRVSTTVGGTQRADSVLRGLDAITATSNDWVLVHDAARPCLHEDDLAQLIAALRDDEVGGLLAVPVADTLKSSDNSQRVLATTSRENLWRALTPQMFRFGLLQRALRESTHNLTDESMAIERLGLAPKLIAGRSDNIKITIPEDLLQAEFILKQRLVK